MQANNSDNYQVISNIPNHNQIQNNITLQVWAEFMLHDKISQLYWTKLFELFPTYQISIKVKDDIVATANSIPFYWDKSLKKLPETGWDWVIEKGIIDKQNSLQPNMLAGLQIVVNPSFQGKRYSYIVLNEMKKIARQNNFEQLLIPVRPSLKHKYPLQKMADYIEWKSENNLPFDPWLRVHQRAGGEILKICQKSMYIKGTIAEWENWTEMKFFQSGKYIIKGALSPIKINLAEDFGEYFDANVWIVHKIKG